jgi:CheY-like chemotaxis protein
MELDQIRMKRALVLEDEPAISRACKKVLTDMGFEVEVALDGLDAVKMLEEKTYNLCLSDIRMPGMNGTDFYRHIEQAFPALARYVIFISGDILGGNTGAFVREANVPFLSKPFTTDELRQIVIDTMSK